MDDSRLSYCVTSLASSEVNEKFEQAKKDFHLLIQQEKTKEENFILKNLAHITLKGMFYLKDGSSEEELQKALGAISFRPLSIYADELAVFNSPKHGHVLVVKVRKTPEIQNLHTEIVNTVRQFATDDIVHQELDEFTPHVSVLYNLPENQIEEAKQYVTSRMLPVTYTLQSFLFMKDVAGVKKERELVKEYFPSQSL